MNKYDVTLTAHYEKTVSVYADTPEQAKEKIETVLFDTDIIQFMKRPFPSMPIPRSRQRKRLKPSFSIRILSSSLTRILSAGTPPSLSLTRKKLLRTSVPTRTTVLSTTIARTARTSVPYVGSVCVRTSAKIDMSYQALNLVIHPAMDTKFACQGDAPETPL